MDAEESCEWAEALLERIDTFDADCAEAQYTDTDHAWELLRECREYLAALIEAE